MYTELKTYQIIIALLKKYGTARCVLSAGSRNVPFVDWIEEDTEFHCYSVELMKEVRDILRWDWLKN